MCIVVVLRRVEAADVEVVRLTVDFGLLPALMILLTRADLTGVLAGVDEVCTDCRLDLRRFRFDMAICLDTSSSMTLSSTGPGAGWP